MKKYLAEMVGTAMLVIGGCGAAILAGQQMGVFGIAIAFGLSLLVIAYTIGNISGGHVNPAVTIGLAIARKFPKSEVLPYIAFQIIGGLIGAAIVWTANGMQVGMGGFAANTLASGISLSSGLVIESVMTAFLVLAVLFTTHHKFASNMGGVLVGGVLALIHIVSIPMTNTSVNPARSIAVAFYQGGEAVSQLWIFIVAPVIGAIIAAGIYKMLTNSNE